MRAGVWIVAPQEGLVVGQLPMPAAGFLSDVKIPPANTAMSVDCAKLKPENNSVQKSIPRILFKMTSQQKLNCWRHYNGRRRGKSAAVSYFGTSYCLYWSPMLSPSP